MLISLKLCWCSVVKFLLLFTIHCPPNPCSGQDFFFKYVSGLYRAFALLAKECSPEWSYVALMLSALPPARPLTSWYQFTLLGEQGHQNISSLSRAISHKVGRLGNRTSDPSIHLGQSRNYTTIVYPTMTLKWMSLRNVHMFGIDISESLQIHVEFLIWS